MTGRSETLQQTLPNGLKVILRETHDAPVASFWVWYRVGSRNELPGLTGISHWVEHMQFKGTPSLAKGAIFAEVSRKRRHPQRHDLERLDRLLRDAAGRPARPRAPDRVGPDGQLPLRPGGDRVRADRHPLRAAGRREQPRLPALRGGRRHRLPRPSLPATWSSATKPTCARSPATTSTTTTAAHYLPNNAFVVAVGDFDAEELLRPDRERLRRHPAPASRCRPSASTEPPQLGERRRHPPPAGADRLPAHRLPRAGRRAPRRAGPARRRRDPLRRQADGPRRRRTDGPLGPALPRARRGRAGPLRRLRLLADARSVPLLDRGDRAARTSTRPGSRRSIDARARPPARRDRSPTTSLPARAEAGQGPVRLLRPKASPTRRSGSARWRSSTPGGAPTPSSTRSSASPRTTCSASPGPT